MKFITNLNPGFIIFFLLSWPVLLIPSFALIGSHPRGAEYTNDQLPGLIYTALLFLFWLLVFLSPILSSKCKRLILRPKCHDSVLISTYPYTLGFSALFIGLSIEVINLL